MMTKQGKPDMMTASQVSEIFGVNVNTVHDWIYAGKLPGAFKISEIKNAPYLIPASSVEALKKERDQSAN